MTVRRLIRVREAVIVGAVYAELLRGARTHSEARNLEADLDGPPFLNSDRESWRRTGELLPELQIQGNSIPSQCAAIVALALQRNLPVLTRDQRFSRVCRIQLHPFN
ncbi:MAG TPA: PIN domain-containing protein [Dehalococcoidia bacterium]|nr:PIN domain-containing protein [Dehalococcoidia bacterium]